MADKSYIVRDGFIDLEGGVDSGRAPNTIAKNQVSFAVNTTFRGAFPTCRPGINLCDLLVGDVATFQSGVFQGAGIYHADDGNSIILVSVSGHIWQIDPQKNFELRDITISGDPNSGIRPQVWMEQVECFMVIQDGQSEPLIYSPSQTLRRATMQEVPVGCMMAYGMGRLWVALPSLRQFTAGDIVYGGTAPTGLYGQRDAALQFTENTFLATGGAFSIPTDSGQITSMRFLANLDMSLGQGPLQVGTDNTIFSVNTPVDRSTWKSLQYPIQTVSTLGYGPKAQNSTIAVNSDLFYRALDGIRSFVIARRDFGTWGNKPVSSEMNKVITMDDVFLLGYGSAVVFDNRVLTTISPVQSGSGVYHRGLAVLDLNVISGIHQRPDPSWDGAWLLPQPTLGILQIMKGLCDGIERCFILSLNSSCQIGLYELSVDDSFDNNTIANNSINWWFETASYSFGTPMGLKRLDDGKLWYDQIEGSPSNQNKIELTVYMRPDQTECWKQWLTWTECAPVIKCDSDWAGACQQIINYKPQYRTNRRLGQPLDIADPSDDKPARDGYEFQIRIEVAGKLRLKQARLVAHLTEPNTNA